MTQANRSQTNYHAGLAAENIVARNYQERGYQVAGQRWRGTSGEIDLVVRDGDQVVFTEVKKSRTHDMAALRLGKRQIARLFQAASEFVAGEPRGQMTDMRFDLATVDQAGTVEIRENVLMTA